MRKSHDTPGPPVDGSAGLVCKGAAAGGANVLGSSRVLMRRPLSTQVAAACASIDATPDSIVCTNVKSSPYATPHRNV